MNTIITPEKIELTPGTVVHMLGNWQDYQRLVQQLDDRNTWMIVSKATALGAFPKTIQYCRLLNKSLCLGISN